MTKLAIVAGKGDLPRLLAASCDAAARPYVVVALEGFADPADFPGVPVLPVRLGRAASAFPWLKDQGVGAVVLAGSVTRPTLADLRPDGATARLIARIGLGALGDDGVLRAVVAIVENEGFAVEGADALVAGLLCPAGLLGRVPVPDGAGPDLAAGWRAARALGAADIGQAVAVRAGVVIDREDRAGTDALIARVGASGATGAVLVKTAKPGQEKRADLPVVGVATVERAAAAGFRGIALEAGATLVIGRRDVVSVADRLGVFVAGLVEGEVP